MSSLSGKVAIVLGGAMGIGEACARRMLQEGAKVVIGDVNAERGAATCETLLHSHPQNVFFVHCDVTEDEQIEAVFDGAAEKFGAVDICVVTAGICDESNWKKLMQINLVGSLSVTKIAEQKMGTQNGGKGGHVVLTASAVGLIPWAGLEAYTATKHGLVGFVRSYGIDKVFARCGVRVNLNCPNVVQTEMVPNVVSSPIFTREEFQELLRNAPEMPVEHATDALMKLLLGNYNGSSMVFTKDGIQAFDEEERNGKFLANMYDSKDSKE